MDVATQQPGAEPWHFAKDKQAHGPIVNAFRTIDGAQKYRRDLNLHHLRLYGDYAAAGLSGERYTPRLRAVSDLRLNVVHSVIDAAVAQIGTNKPRVMYLTDGGDYSLQRKAKARSKFVHGSFAKYKLYRAVRQVVRDSCIFGTGFLLVAAGDDKLIVERVFPDEIVVDDLEARYAEPRSLFRIKEVSRQWLLQKYPSKRKEIMAASLIRDPFALKRGVADQVSIIEAWHLPSREFDEGERKHDGRHCIVLDTVTLEDETYDRQSFPILPLRLGERPLGFWGIGFAERLTGIQVELNWTLRKIQRHMNLAATQIWVAKGSPVAQRKMSNEEFAVNEYTGTKPEILAPQPIAPEFFNHVDRLYMRAFEEIGISQMSAQQKKPQGLNSGAALREYNDQQSARFQHFGQHVEEFHVDAGEMMIDATRELVAKGVDVKIVAKGDRGLETISFEDIDMKPNEYLCQPFPVSFLPATPAGKLEYAKELGTTFPQVQPFLLSLFDMPDIQSVVSLATADVDDVRYMIERMIDHGDQFTPDAFQNKQLAVKMMQSAVLRYEVMGVDDKRIDLLRQYCATAQQQLQAMPPQPPIAAQTPGAPPMPDAGGAPPMGAPAVAA